MLTANMSLILIGCVVILVVVFGLFVAPYLRKHGLDKADMELTGKMLDVITAILGEVKFQDESKKDLMMTVITVCEASVKYVGEMLGDLPIEDQKKAAYDAAESVLVELHIEMTDGLKTTVADTIGILIDNLSK